MEAAVAYIRVSSLRQVEEGGSLDSQAKQVDQYVASKGYQLIKLFREEGESAKTEQRPELQDMLRYCRDRRNNVAVVIIPKIDRLARNVGDYANVKLQLNRIGVRLESLGERIEDTPVGRFTETILASVAQLDNEIRAERCRGGMLDAVAAGRWALKVPIGYRRIRYEGKATIEPDPKTAPIIRRAFNLLARDDQGVPAVQDFLLRSGIFRAKNAVYRLIHNEVYIGRIHAFGKVFEGKHPYVALIDEETFHKARCALKSSKAPQRYLVASEDFPLRRTALCPCGHYYTASWSRGKQGQRYPYFRCIRCQGKSYRRTVVEGFFRLELAAYRGEEHAWNRLKAALIAMESEVQAEREAMRTSSLAKITKLRSVRDVVGRKNAEGIIPDDVAVQQFEQLGNEMDQIAKDLPNSIETDATSLVGFARRFFTSLHELWEGFSLTTKKDLLRNMFPNGILYLPDQGFRNRENSLSERFKRVVSGDDLRLVELTPEFSKELLEWFTCIRAIVGDKPLVEEVGKENDELQLG